MDNIDSEFWKKELSNALKDEKMDSVEFLTFMEGKIKRLALSVDEFGWGVFPILDEQGVVRDIRMVVPIIYDDRSLCVNIHEFTHAYEVFLSLGSVYEWNVDESERRAKESENRYLSKKMKSNE